MRIPAFNPCSDHWQDLSFCAHTQFLYFHSENKHQMAYSCTSLDIWLQKHPWTSIARNFNLLLRSHILTLLKCLPLNFFSIFSPKPIQIPCKKEQNAEDLIHNGMFPLSKSKLTAFYFDTFLTNSSFVGRPFLHFDSCIQRGTTKLILLGNTPWKHF